MSGKQKRVSPPVLQMFRDLRRFRSPSGHWATQCDLYQLETITGVPPHMWGLKRPDTANAVIFSTGQINLKEELRSPVFDIARKSAPVTSRVAQFFVEWDLEESGRQGTLKTP